MSNDDGQTQLMPRNETAKRSRRAKARFPLVLKLFLLTALLIAVVVAISVGVTVKRANGIATKSVNDSIASAGRLFEDLERRRFKDLSLGALTLSRDPSFNAYIEKALYGGGEAAEPAAPSAPGATPPPEPPAVPESAPADTAAAAPVIDLASIIDQLSQRKELLGSDLLLLTDDQGFVVSRTDSPDITGTRKVDLYGQEPLLRGLIDNPPAPDPVTEAVRPLAGTIALDDRLYQAALVPLSIGGKPPIGYLINAYQIDEEFANHIASATSAEVLFIPSGRTGNIARSTSAPSASSVRAMNEMSSVMGASRRTSPRTLTIDGSSYVMTGQPLLSSGKAVGAAVFVRSLDRELAPFRSIERTLLLAGGVALLLAFLLSFLIAKRLTTPIERLADMAQAVTEGDYSVRPEIRRSDEVGILSRSFASMISALRDKAELEGLYEEMAARERDRSAAGSTAVFHPAKAEEGTILVSDLRGVPSSTADGDAAGVIDLVSRAMKLQQEEVIRQDGEVREIEGHRLVSTFGGERGIIHALRAARAISEELALHPTADGALSVGFGIATGEYVTGSVDLQQESGLVMVGNAPLLALLFAWEAPSETAFISLETAQAASTEMLSSATRDEVRLRWLPAPLPVMSLPLRSMSTGVMRSMATEGGETVRLGATSPGAPPAAAELAPGSVFANRYRIEQVLGRGGMGVVYKATDQQLDETVAIKTLSGDMLSRSQENLERFKREIRLARKITHRNVLRTFDYGEAEGVYFISMEYVRGYTLSELLEETPRVAPRTAIGISRQICRGLEAAHEEGIIHRDIKPQNVLIDQRGEVKLMDFGIARMAEAPEAMTATGLIIGTPHYMSPEQVEGKQLDARTDVYSTGILMYEMLCGQPPFNAPSLTAILTAHLTQQARPPLEIRPEIGSELSGVVMRCLAKQPKERFANAGELLTELDRVQTAVAAA